jgi:alkanesulfonate monooxygenase SsuD/methylene tetrahydromethanopterin reductase-like flavin-dependent oxidoreductase (luciferase family)
VPPPLLGAAVSAETAAWAAGWADGLITVNQPVERLRRVVEAFRAGAAGKPMYLQVHLAYAEDEATALANAHQQWASNALDGSIAWELELPEQFEAATRHVRPDDVRETVLVTADPSRLTAELAAYTELGFDGVFVHEVGRDQRRTIELFGAEVLPALAAASPAGGAGR